MSWCSPQFLPRKTESHLGWISPGEGEAEGWAARVSQEIAEVVAAGEAAAWGLGVGVRSYPIPSAEGTTQQVSRTFT